jgi:hypothetical protein
VSPTKLFWDEFTPTEAAQKRRKLSVRERLVSGALGTTKRRVSKRNVCGQPSTRGVRMKNLVKEVGKAERLAEVTQQVGFTLWQLQELEGVTAQYFVLVAQATKGMGIEAGNTLEAKAKKRTFGATFNECKKAGLLSKELQVRFENLLSERNWLVHSSRADSRSAIHSDLAMQRLLARLNKIAEDSRSLLKVIGVLSEAHVKEHGVTKEYIDKKSRELLNEWQESDAI